MPKYSVDDVLEAIHANVTQLLLDERTNSFPVTPEGWRRFLDASFHDVLTGDDTTQVVAHHIVRCVFYIIWYESQPAIVKKLRTQIDKTTQQLLPKEQR